MEHFNLILFRQAFCLSRKEASKALGVSLSLWTKMENGERSVTPWLSVKINNAVQEVNARTQDLTTAQALTFNPIQDEDDAEQILAKATNNAVVLVNFLKGRK